MRKILLCPECGNRLRNFIKGKVVNGEFIKDKEGETFGVCVNDHKTFLRPEEARLKFKIKKEEM